MCCQKFSTSLTVNWAESQSILNLFEIYLPKCCVDLSSNSMVTVEFFLLQNMKKLTINPTFELKSTQYLWLWIIIPLFSYKLYLLHATLPYFRYFQKRSNTDNLFKKTQLHLHVFERTKMYTKPSMDSWFYWPQKKVHTHE